MGLRIRPERRWPRGLPGNHRRTVPLGASRLRCRRALAADRLVPAADPAPCRVGRATDNPALRRRSPLGDGVGQRSAGRRTRRWLSAVRGRHHRPARLRRGRDSRRTRACSCRQAVHPARQAAEHAGRRLRRLRVHPVQWDLADGVVGAAAVVVHLPALPSSDSATRRHRGLGQRTVACPCGDPRRGGPRVRRTVQAGGRAYPGAEVVEPGGSASVRRGRDRGRGQGARVRRSAADRVAGEQPASERAADVRAGRSGSGVLAFGRAYRADR